MKTVVICMIIVLFPGCSMLKNRLVNRADSNFVQREQLESSVLVQEKTDSEIRLTFTDSGKHTYLVEISPEGEFAFSPLTGYTGKAKLLKISGKGEVWKRGLIAATTQNEIKVDSASSKSVKSEVEVSNSHASVKTERLGKWYVWTLIVAGALIGWLIVKERLRG